MTAMCPGCRALLEPTDRACPYCGWDLKRTDVRRHGGEVERGTRAMGGLVHVLIFANVLLAAVTAMLDARLAPQQGAGPLGALLDGILSPHPGVLILLGGELPRRILMHGEFWRLFCPMFLHGGLLHIAFNMMALRNIGGLVVEAYGTGKALAVYLLTGLCGSAAHTFWWWFRFADLPKDQLPKDIVAIGASTALFGYVGVIAALGFRIGGERGKALWWPMLKAAGLILLIGFIIPFLDNAGHIGGLASGLAFGAVCSFGVRARGNPTAVRVWDVVAVVLCLAVVASFLPPLLDVVAALR